jgi:replication factor C small subunit
MFLPWTEKYRPKTLDEVIGQEAIVKVLKKFVETKELPNMLFAGPPGVGKTTTAIALAHELYKDDVKGNFLELNASDERGIDVVRGKIKDFARSLSLSNVPFKIIFLDEADALTPDAQHALRRTMEKYSSITRFILSCNYSSKIIEPLQSRVSVFRFSPLTKQDVITLIKRVEQAEGLSIDEDVYDLIYYLSEGDMRRVLNIMQGSAVFGTHITREIVLKITSRAEPEKVRTMMEQALNGEFKQARDTLNELFINYGMSGEDIITQMFKEVDNLNVSERIKVIIMDKIGEYDFRMVEGANERIQLEALLAYLALLGERLKKA